MQLLFIAVGLALTVGIADTAQAALEQCAARKLTAAARFTQCRFKAAARGTDPAACDEKFASKWDLAESTAAKECPNVGDRAAVQALLTQQIADLAATLSGGPAPILRNRDNGDGTITDTATALMWEKLSDDGGVHDKDNTYLWTDALTRIADLNAATFAGYADWRLPNINELQSAALLAIHDEPNVNVSVPFHVDCVPGCTILTCACTADPGFEPSYWSSTSVQGSPTQAWTVSYGDGSVVADVKNRPWYVRAVRAVAAGTTAALAADSPAATCHAKKLIAAGKYAACRLKHESKLMRVVKEPDFSKCDAKLTTNWSKAEAAGSGQCPTTGDETEVRATITQQHDDLTDLFASEVGFKPRLQTGQSGCYAVDGAAISCAGSGQDGESQAGLARQYVDNGDGTITDAHTGLMWEKLGDDDSLHDKDTTVQWRDAFAKIAALNSVAFAGHSDWRLPKLRELQTLLDYGATAPAVSAPFNSNCLPGCTPQTCSCTSAREYWSSTPELAKTGARSFAAAWFVNFVDGVIYSNFETNAFAVRAVRGS